MKHTRSLLKGSMHDFTYKTSPNTTLINSGLNSRRQFLYIDVSRFIKTDNRKSIGEGLFTKMAIPPYTVITMYIGDIITADDYKIRDSNGKGGYALHIRKGWVLDCYEYRKTAECWASFANCSSTTGKLVDSRLDLPFQNPKKSNAHIVIKNGTAYIVSLSNEIPPGNEILVSYSNFYRFD